MDVLPFAFSCAPVTDMTTALIVCEAAGDHRSKQTILTRRSAQSGSAKNSAAMLKDPCVRFAGRTQALAYMWCFQNS